MVSKIQTIIGNESCFYGPEPTPRIPSDQSLVMTPQLMQAIKLLQLSNLDLAAFVDELATVSGDAILPFFRTVGRRKLCCG